MPTSTSLSVNKKGSALSLPKGFTLVEVMIAITIVAMLSVLAITAYSSAQKAGRDARRRAEITAISSSIEAKKDSSTGVYSYAVSDFQKEFVQVSSSNAGLDPSGYPYCILLYTTGGSVTVPLTATMVPASLCAFTGGTSIATTNTTGFGTSPFLYNLNAAIISGGGFNPSSGTSTIKGWILCAPLENTTTPFCKFSSSLTQ